MGTHYEDDEVFLDDLPDCHCNGKYCIGNGCPQCSEHYGNCGKNPQPSMTKAQAKKRKK